MCLYPKIMLNPKYKPNKKNKGKPPICTDERLRYVSVGCGQCYECRKQKASQWKVRMMEEIRHDKTGQYITLTFSPEKYEYYKNKSEINEDDNELATSAVRDCLERIRKKTKKSMKHWLITELGHTGTERIHIHGIIWGENARELIEEKWQNGWIYIGDYVNEKTINYIIKYVTKVDTDHREFKGKILCSAGIGKNYINRVDIVRNQYKKNRTNETYRARNGLKYALPLYYRNKLYTEEEREKIWIEKIEKGEKWVCGEKVNIDDEKAYIRLLNEWRKKTERIYQFNEQKWNEEKYLKKLKKMRENLENKNKELSL